MPRAWIEDAEKPEVGPDPQDRVGVLARPEIARAG
jgi:hypothetical protein